MRAFLIKIILFYAPFCIGAPQVLVQVDANERALSALPGFVRFVGKHKRYAVVNKTPSVAKRLLRFKSQPNYRYKIQNDPEFKKSWGLYNLGQSVKGVKGKAGSDVGVINVWKRLQPSKGPIVVLLDSGLDLEHPELKSKLWKNPKESANGKDDDGNGFIDDVRGWNFVDDTSDLTDAHDHGTLVGGIVAAEHNREGSRGVAPYARLMILKMMDRFGVGTTADAIRAIEYAVEKGATLFNISWGGEHYDPALMETMKWAGTRGALFVVAAGNAGKNNDLKEKTYPAAFRLENILAVAAYDNRDQLWEHSNYGKESVDLGAPGVEIFGPTRQGYGYGTGTSFAAPFVTGVAAALKAQFPKMNLLQIKRRLLRSSQVIHYYEKERTQTAGRVHLENAIENINPLRPRPPSTWEKHSGNTESPHPYPNHFNQSYRIHHRGATRMRVHFSRLSLEQDVDVLELVDQQGRVVWTYSGEIRNQWSADVLGEVAELKLKSDYISTHWGFAVDGFEVSYEPTQWYLSQPRLKEKDTSMGQYFRKLLNQANPFKQLGKFLNRNTK